MAYIPRSGSPQPMEQGERTRERDEDEMISGDVEEVSHFFRQNLIVNFNAFNCTKSKYWTLSYLCKN